LRTLRLGEKKPAVNPIQARSPDEVQRNPGIQSKPQSPRISLRYIQTTRLPKTNIGEIFRRELRDKYIH
jgi:hypothetical protein